MLNIYASDILLFYRISYLTASYILFGKHFSHSQSKCLPPILQQQIDMLVSKKVSHFYIYKKYNLMADVKNLCLCSVAHHKFFHLLYG